MILIIAGEENFFSLKKLNQIRDKFTLDNKDMGEITEYDVKNFDIQDFSKNALSVPFFEEKRLFILRDTLAKEFSDKETDSILKVLNNAPETSVIVFFEHIGLDNKRSDIKEIEKIAKKIWNFEKLNNQQLSSWVKKEIAFRGSFIDKDALSELISNSDNNIWQLNQEIEKLTIYKKNKKIEMADIRQTTQSSIESNIFLYIESIGKKNKKKALTELNNLLETGEEPVYLLRMIIYQVRIMLIVKSLINNNFSKNDIVSKTKKHPFVIKKTTEQVMLFKEEQLKNMYNKVFNLEISIKRGTQNPEKALVLFTTDVC